MYICVCNGVTEREIRKCAETGGCTFSALQCELGVGSGCGQCQHEVGVILSEVRQTSVMSPVLQPA